MIYEAYHKSEVREASRLFTNYEAAKANLFDLFDEGSIMFDYCAGIRVLYLDGDEYKEFKTYDYYFDSKFNAMGFKEYLNSFNE